MLKIAILIGLFTLFLGCSTKYPIIEIDKSNRLVVKKLDQEKIEEINHLYNQLMGLSDDVSMREAKDLANSMIIYSMYLSNKYKLVSPPNFQNFLVNFKIKERGLCYQWMYDLSSFVEKKSYQTFSFYHAVDSLNTIFEHNVLVVSSKKSSFENGIIIDPWRDSGTIHSIKLKDDKDYHWNKRAKIY